MNLSDIDKYGSQVPTESFYDDTLKSFMDIQEVSKELEEFGMSLYPWQDLVLRTSLGVSNGSLYYGNVGLSVPRQNGKSEILVWRAIIGMLYLKQDILYTSYNKDSAKSIYTRMQDIVDDSSKLKKFIKVGDQHNKMELRAFDPRTGEPLGMVEFHTRAGGKARGESYDVIFFDESQFLTSEQIASATPTTATFADSQVWYVGTPEPIGKIVSRGATAGMISDGVFRRIRRDILFKGQAHSCFFEWGVDSLVPKEDKRYWYVSNPSLGFKPSKGRGLTERSFLVDNLSNEEFAVERLGFWSRQEKSSVIDAGTWDNLSIDKSVEKFYTSPDSHDSMVLSVKSDYEDEWIDVALAFRYDGATFTRIADSFPMDRPWVENVMGIVMKMVEYDKCKEIIIDGETAQQQITQALRREGRWPRNAKKRHGKVVLATPNHARYSASNLVSKIIAKEVFHSAQPQVDGAVYDAEKRMHGKTWWGFRSISGKTKSGLLETIALAVYAATESETPVVDISSNEKSGFRAPEWRSV